MPSRPLLRACVLVAALAGALPTAALASDAITKTSIGGAQLGAKATTYKSLLGKSFTTRYGDGSTRLLFDNGELQVYLGAKTKRGIALITSDSGYKLGSLHPCSPISDLTKVYGARLQTLSAAGQASPIAYRLGSLVFSVSPGQKIGAIALLAPGVPLSLVTASGQCGTGEEG